MHVAGIYSVSTQTQQLINKGRQQPVVDLMRNLEAIPAGQVMVTAAARHALYPFVGGWNIAAPSGV